MLGDSVTTDHISPAGAIKTDGPAGKYLIEHGVEPQDFNSYGSRRGNHEVMIRGTFANIRLRNQLAPGTEGGVTGHLPDGEQMSIYDAATRVRGGGHPAGRPGRQGVRLRVVPGLGGQGHRCCSGCGPCWPSRFERIHRSNLVGMGVLPLQFAPGESAESLGLTGQEVFEITGLEEMNSGAVPREVTVRADGTQFRAVVRIDTPGEAEYFRHGGIMQYVLRSLLS